MKNIFPDQSFLFVRYHRRLFLLFVQLVLCSVVMCSASQAEDTPSGVQEGTVDSHPALIDSPTHTTTSSGRIGDAINVAFIGSEEELHHMLSVSGWLSLIHI